MSDIFRLRNGRSRAINAENPTGEKGKGGIDSKSSWTLQEKVVRA